MGPQVSPQQGPCRRLSSTHTQRHGSATTVDQRYSHARWGPVQASAAFQQAHLNPAHAEVLGRALRYALREVAHPPQHLRPPRTPLCHACWKRAGSGASAQTLCSVREHQAAARRSLHVPAHSVLPRAGPNLSPETLLAQRSTCRLFRTGRRFALALRSFSSHCGACGAGVGVGASPRACAAGAAAPCDSGSTSATTVSSSPSQAFA